MTEKYIRLAFRDSAGRPFYMSIVNQVLVDDVTFKVELDSSNLIQFNDSQLAEELARRARMREE